MNKKLIFYSFLEIILTIIILRILGFKSSKILTIAVVIFYFIKNCHDISLIPNSSNSLTIIRDNFRFHLKELSIVFIGYLVLFLLIISFNTYVSWKIILLLVFSIFLKEMLFLLYISDELRYFGLPKKIFTLGKGSGILLTISFFWAITTYSVLGDNSNKLCFLWISFGLIAIYLIKKVLENKISISKLVLSFFVLFLDIYIIFAIFEFSYVIKNFPLTS